MLNSIWESSKKKMETKLETILVLEVLRDCYSGGNGNENRWVKFENYNRLILDLRY